MGVVKNGRLPYIIAANGGRKMARIKKRNENALTMQEVAFVDAYMSSNSATEAAKKAGYASAGTLMKRPRIRHAIEKRTDAALARASITRDRTIAEIGRIAFANIDDYIDDNGKFVRPERKKMAAVSEIVTTQDARGSRTSVKMHGKMEALNMLAKYFNMFKEPPRVTVNVSIGEQIDRAYARIIGSDQVNDFGGRGAASGEGGTLPFNKNSPENSPENSPDTKTIEKLNDR